MRKILLILCIVLGFGMSSCLMRGCADASETVYQETKVSTLLKKYQYFKDMSASIDKYRADIEMYQSEIADLKADSTTKDREDKYYIQQRKSELIGIISAHNQLCSDYNSAMSKINYAFCNQGTMPATNLTPLPREFKPYINSLK